MSARTATVAAAVAALALGLGTWLVLNARQSPPLEIDGYVLATPRDLPPVELVDERGESFRPHGFLGHWSFLYFGYTYCPDVCPLTLVELANVKRELEADGISPPTVFYFVSVDPRRDTPARGADGGRSLGASRPRSADTGLARGQENRFERTGSTVYGDGPEGG